MVVLQDCDQMEKLIRLFRVLKIHVYEEGYEMIFKSIKNAHLN